MCTPTCKIIATPRYFLWSHGAAGALWSALGREGGRAALCHWSPTPLDPGRQKVPRLFSSAKTLFTV